MWMWLHFDQFIFGGKGRVNMPVFLDEVPEKAPKIKRPDTRKWLGVLYLLLMSGCTLSFLFWTSERQGLVFWFTALGVPVCTWGILFGFRRIIYKADQVWAESWNIDRNALWNEEITRGQRAAWVVASGVITQAGGRADKILSAIYSSSPIIQVQKIREGRGNIRHSKLSGFERLSQHTDFKESIKTLITQIEPVLAKIPRNVSCFFATDFNTPHIHDAAMIASEILMSETGCSFTFLNGKGFEVLDCWLDNAWRNPSLLLVLSAEIRETPRDSEGEAITITVMLNRKHPEISDAVQLRRPEKYKNDSLAKTLSRALMWGELSSPEIKGSWATGPIFSQSGDWHSACEENELTLNMTDEHKNIDEFIGYVGASAPWLAVAISSIAARTGVAQIIAVETDKNDVWIAGVTPGDNTGIRQDTL